MSPFPDNKTGLSRRLSTSWLSIGALGHLLKPTCENLPQKGQVGLIGRRVSRVCGRHRASHLFLCPGRSPQSRTGQSRERRQYGQGDECQPTVFYIILVSRALFFIVFTISWVVADIDRAAMLVIIPYLTLLASLAVPAASFCYYPDGSIAGDDTPCTDATTNSTCCGAGYACLGLTSQFFLCEATSLINPGGSTYVRGSCTDPTWRSANCPSVCVDGQAPNNDNTGGGEGVGNCPNSDKLFYCIDFAQSAVNCTAQQNVIVFEQSPTVLTTIGVAASTASATSTFSSGASANPSLSSLSTSFATSAAGTSANPASSSAPTGAGSNKPSQSQSPSQGDVVGIAIGVSVGVSCLLITATGVFFIIRRKRRNDDKKREVPTSVLLNDQPPPFDAAGWIYDPSKGSYYPQPPRIYEAPDSEASTRYELEAR